LLGYLLGQLRLPEGKLAYIPQELPSEDCASLVEEVRKLPHEQLGQVMTILAGLGSEAERVLESAQASPGEARKLLLALQSSRLPQLVVLDEPTNHLDLPAIELLEEALAGAECALLLVSHDNRFIERLTSTCWSFMPDAEGDTLVLKANLPSTG
jgi:ATPase subunit of ABC transporter with duplicated ATPase domains